MVHKRAVTPKKSELKADATTPESHSPSVQHSSDTLTQFEKLLLGVSLKQDAMAATLNAAVSNLGKIVGRLDSLVSQVDTITTTMATGESLTALRLSVHEMRGSLQTMQSSSDVSNAPRDNLIIENNLVTGGYDRFFHCVYNYTKPQKKPDGME